MLEKLIITLTSWKGRIDVVCETIHTLLNQTLNADIIYLNLSSAEFVNKEDALPKNLTDLKRDNKIIINWVDGEDTKTMKKVFPILQYINDNDMIIMADDDILYPSNFIESLVKSYRKHNCPITGSPVKNNIGFYYNCGMGSLITKKMLIGWESFCTNEVIHTYQDDRVYTYILLKNGYLYKYTPEDGIVTLYDEKKYNNHNSKNATGFGLDANKIIRDEEIYTKTFNSITGISVKDMYNKLVNGVVVINQKVNFVKRYNNKQSEKSVKTTGPKHNNSLILVDQMPFYGANITHTHKVIRRK